MTNYVKTEDNVGEFMAQKCPQNLNIHTVKPVHEVTSIKQSPVVEGHLFLVQSLNISYESNLFKEVTCLKRSLNDCICTSFLIPVIVV